MCPLYIPSKFRIFFSVALDVENLPEKVHNIMRSTDRVNIQLLSYLERPNARGYSFKVRGGELKRDLQGFFI